MINIHKFIAQTVSIPRDSVNIPKDSLTQPVLTDGLQLFFGVAAAVAVLVIAISAFKLTISQGDPAGVKKARDSVIYACIGLAITLSGFAIVTFVIERI